MKRFIKLMNEKNSDSGEIIVLKKTFWLPPLDINIRAS